MNTGFVQSPDLGRTWQPLYVTTAGEAQPEGEIRVDVATAGTLYLPSRQFWKSTNAGVTWAASGTGLPAGVLPTYFRQAANGSLYLRSGNNLYKSSNRGDAWSLSGTLPGTSPIFDLAQSDPERMYYVDGPTMAVYASRDEGRTWKEAGRLSVPGLVTGAAHSVGVHSTNPEAVYVSIGCSCVSNTARSYVSANGGQTFQEAPDGLGEFLSLTSYRDGFLYANNSPIGISRSRTGGTTWTSLFNAPGVGVVSFSTADPRSPATIYGRAVTSTNDRVTIKSGDAGDSFALLNATLTPTLAQPAAIDLQLAEGAVSTHTLRLQAFEDPAWPLGVSLTKSAAWVTIAAPSGTTPYAPVLTFNAGSLAPGVYETTIQVDAPQAFNKTVRVNARITVVRRGLLGAQYLISTAAGSGGTYLPEASTGPAKSFAIGTPLAVAIDSGNRLLLASGPRLLRLEGDTLKTIAGGPSFGTTGDGGDPLLASLSSIYAIVPTATGDLYLNEQLTPKVRRITANRIDSYLDRGRIPTFAGSPGLARDAAGRLVLVNANRLVRYDGQTFTDLSPYVFSLPRAIAIGPNGTIYIANQGTDQIIQVTPSGETSVLAGSGTAGFSGDNGPARQAQLNDPNGLAVDRAGTVYFSDERNNRVRAIAPDGTIRTIAGSGIEGFAGDGGTSLAAAFNRPGDLAIDSGGSLYVADRQNQRVRTLTPENTATAKVDALLHGASGDTRLSPGSLFSIYGSQLATGTGLSEGTPWPTTLAGASVSINGVAAPLYYVSPTQINGQVPYETTAGNAEAVVTVDGAASSPATFPVLAANPGTLVYAGDHAVAVNYPSGTVNATNAPAKPGEVVLVYFSGIGRPDVDVLSGAGSPSIEPFARSRYPYEILIGGQVAVVHYFGLAPGYPALCQANFTVPDLEPGEYTLTLTVNGESSRPAKLSVGPK